MLKPIASIISLTILIAACTSGHAVAPTTALQIIQDRNSFSASLAAAMEFDDDGVTVVLPTLCAVKSIPVAWSGKVFSGWAYEGDDQKTVMLVRGRVSDDGSWIEAMKFSRKVLDKTSTGVEFEISPRYIPIAGGVSGSSIGIFERTGDVGKHVESVNYDMPNTRYVSTGWGGIDGIPPSLKRQTRKSGLRDSDHARTRLPVRMVGRDVAPTNPE